MSDETTAAKAKADWQAQHVEVPSMSYLRLRALKHRDYGRNRSLLEYGAAGVGVFVAVVLIVTAESLLLRAGLTALIVGGVYWLVEWRRRRLAWNETSPAEADAALTFYTRELGRLRDAHRGLRKTHVLASVPGALLLSAWLLLGAGAPFSNRWWQAALVALGVMAWIGSMIWHEAEKAGEYQRELDALRQGAD